MPQTNGLRLGVAASCLALLAVGACTFPDVDYEDVDPESPMTAACAMPTSCEPEVTSCSKQADSQRGACLSKCSNGQTADCTACQDSHASAVSVCVAQCESCSAAKGCANATDSCKALLGAP